LVLARYVPNDDDVQIKFRAPAYLKELIDQGVMKSKLRIPNLNQWLIEAAIKMLESQGIAVELKAEPKRKAGR
jgi:hypothetical protein